MHKLSRAVILLSVVLIFAVQASLAQEQSSSIIQTEATLLEQSKPVERELKAEETQAYKITLEKGQFLGAAVNQRGIDVVVRIFAPDGSKIAEIDSPNGTQGDEPIALEAKTAGIYRVEVASPEKDAKPGRYEIRINELLSAKNYAARIAERNRKRQAVIAWLKDNAVPLKTVEAGNGFADLQPLKKVFKDVRFVGLGEATHGTREFFQFKHRMLEFLVRELGFRVFAIEASYAASQNINDYVMGKTDDGAKALDSLGFWTWNTEEVRAMMDWMRSYNRSVSAEKRVKFAGLDFQVNDAGKERLLEYLKRVAPERVADTETFFKIDDRELTRTSFFEQGEKAKDALAKLAELKNKYNDLFVFLEINGASWNAKSNRAEYEQMREYARVMAQYADAYTRADIKTSSAARDVYMADNFRRLVEREPAGTRFVIWAHNGHISADDNANFLPLGFHLRRLYGKDYYALGFSFNQGAFQAREQQPKDAAKIMLMSFTANSAPAESVDWYLAQTGVNEFIVDFRSAQKNADINEWLTTSHPMRNIGSTYTPNFDRFSFVPTTISKQYDGLFFIDTTTRARPNPLVKNVAPTQ